MNEKYKEIGGWIQYPKVIKNVEKSGDQVRLIEEKMKYRRGR